MSFEHNPINYTYSKKNLKKKKKRVTILTLLFLKKKKFLEKEHFFYMGKRFQGYALFFENLHF